MVDVNHARASVLARVPGIGKALAAAIVLSREREGFFRGPEDLVRIRGIGPGLAHKLALHLAFNLDPWPTFQTLR
jgi:competence protein ComEA